jgi:nucleoside-diphosphate-sugar epimerase
MVEALLAEGHDVTVLHRGRGTPFGDRVTEIHGDRNDGASVREAVGDTRFDLVFDNVYDFGQGTTAAQVEATVEAVRHGGLHRYVFMSSVAVYPDGGSGEALCREEDDLVPATDPNPYAVHKAESERALFRQAKATDLPVTTLRPAFVYGPHNPFDRESFFWDRLRAGRRIIVPGDGSRAMQWVHAEDVAAATVQAAGAAVARGRAYNLAGPPLTQLEYVRTLARVAGVEADVALVPRERLVAAGGGLMEPPFYFGVYLDVPPIPVAGDRLRNELGFELRALEAGLEETWRWYLEQDRPAPDTAWEEGVLDAWGG